MTELGERVAVVETKIERLESLYVDVKAIREDVTALRTAIGDEAMRNITREHRSGKDVLLSKRAAGVLFSVGVVMAGLIAGLIDKLIQ